MITTTLIIPGMHGSGPGHWQTWMQARIKDARRVEQADWDTPVLSRWTAAVQREINRAPGAVFLVAHSFGCLAAVSAAAAANQRERIAGALLVAPADPDRFCRNGLRHEIEAAAKMTMGIADDLPKTSLGFPSIIVASADDPWLPLTRAAWWAERWGSSFRYIGHAGHINIDSGFGPWPEGLALFQELRRAQDSVLTGEIGSDTPAAFAASAFKERRHKARESHEA